MPIDDIRAKQRADQTQAIKTRLEAGSIVRIGNRLPLTGRYEVLESDGGISNNGVKVYNAQEQYGDRVLAYPRLDGTIALDSEKGSIVRPPNAFPVCPGYLKGQVFNCEEPKKKKPGNAWILYQFEGRFYVGGYQETPKLIYDPIPPNSPIYDIQTTNTFTYTVRTPDPIRTNFEMMIMTGQVWGDSEGWEASFIISFPNYQNLFTGSIARYVTESGQKDYNLGSVQTSVGFVDRGAYRYSGSYKILKLGIGHLHEYFQNINKRAVTDLNTISTINTTEVLRPYPAPYNNFYERRGIPIYDQINDQSHLESYSILSRSRTATLFAHIKSTIFPTDHPYYIFAEERSTDFIWSDGVNAITLFTDLRDRPNYLYTFGNQYNQGNTDYNWTREYMYHHQDMSDPITIPYQQSLVPFPIINSSYKLHDFSLTHLSISQSRIDRSEIGDTYSVTASVFDCYNKKFVTENKKTSVEMLIWAIPANSRIVDTCAWVP